MNLIVFLDICSTLGFGVAFYYVFCIRQDHLYYQTRFLLYILMGLYFAVGLTNIMEHTGITSFFDPYEEYLEILFMPFFLFFMYTLIARLELVKQQKGEIALKKALERGESEQSKSDAILAAIGDGISIQDTDLTILYQNDIHKKMVGDHVGKLCHQAYEQNSEPCWGCPLIAAFQDGQVHKAERSAPTDKGTVYVEITASPLINQSGEIYAGIEVVRDITNRKRMTEEILRAQKLESIGLLAGGIAHDFNNLLTSMLGNISLAKTYAGPEEKVVRKLAAAEKASLRAKELTHQLLTFSRGGAPLKKVLNINELLRDSSSFSLHGAKVKCQYDLLSGIWPVKVDPGQFNQVVNNLIINADQAMPDGGSVSIKTENLMLKPGNPMLLEPGRYVQITFVDEGQGISPEDLPKIFDPFYSTKEGGTGLGLATVFSIIKNHKGHITVESTAGQGAKFLLFLPASGTAAEVFHEEENSLVFGEGKILLMDDDEDIRRVAHEMISHIGYQPFQAGNGKEALEMYQAALAEGDRFDAVLLDLTVPGGMGGRETADKMLAIDPSVKIFVSSGYSNDPIMADYQQYGFCGVVPKPYKIQELSKKLHDVLGGPGKKKADKAN